MNNKECEHNYFLASKTNEMKKYSEGQYQFEHYKIGTLVCSKCGETKQIRLDEYVKSVR